MKVFKKGLTTATLQTIGTMFLVTIGATRKIYDNKTTATNYIINQGFNF